MGEQYFRTGDKRDLKNVRTPEELSAQMSRRKFLETMGFATAGVVLGGWSVTEMFKRLFGARKERHLCHRILPQPAHLQAENLRL